MSDLADLVEAFKREVAVPGTFATAFPDTSDDDILGALADAFGEAQLDGFFGTAVLDLDAFTVAPDLSTAGAALIVMYAGMRLVRQQIRNTRTLYKAGPVEVQQSASALVQELKDIGARKKEIVANGLRARRGAGTTFVGDMYVARASQHNFYGGFFAWETVGRGV